MRKINSFTFLSLNGFYKGVDEDTSWHNHGLEENQFSEEQLKSNNILLFGRSTYEMMYNFWPTPMAHDMFPIVAKKMNESEKIVISNSLKKVKWKNTRILSGDIVSQIRKLKTIQNKNLTILGSGSIVTLLSDAGLIDEYQIMIDPVALGDGSTIFKGIKHKLNLKLINTRVFKNSGTVLLTYKKI